MDPSQMTAGQINKALDKLDRESSRITDEFIETGRGHERPSDYLRLEDPLSRRAKENADARYRLRNEIEQRYGPGAPHRLPTGRGFGPRKGEFGGLGVELKWKKIVGPYGFPRSIAQTASGQYVVHHNPSGPQVVRFFPDARGEPSEDLGSHPSWDDALAVVQTHAHGGQLDGMADGLSSDCDEGRCDDCREPECCCRCHSRYAHCSCGAGYTKAEWDALPFVGRVRTVSKGHTDPVKVIESRTCRYCKDSAVEEFLA